MNKEAEEHMEDELGVGGINIDWEFETCGAGRRERWITGLN